MTAAKHKDISSPSRPSPTVRAAGRWGSPSPAWAAAAILALVSLVYLPSLSGGFLWDDDGHLTRPDLRSGEGLVRIWTEVGATQQYYPLLHTAFWLQHRLWGDAPLGYRLVNLLLHAGAAALFYSVLRRLAVSGAFLAALLFALHPVGVETVAWISEQKNTLSAVFYLAAARAYLKFSDNRRGPAYLGATVWFALALLTKTVTATLPAALLVVFWWRRGRLDWRRDGLPLLPWFVLGAAAGLYTAHFERELIGAEGGDFALSFVERCVLAGRVAWFYFAKLLWPANLAFVYPRWDIDAGQIWQWLFPLGALGLLAVLGWVARTRRGPLAAALLFGGMLFPVLGFFNVYPFVHSYVADHFQYLASLGMFALAGAGAALLATRLPGRAVNAGAAALLATLAVSSFRQAGNYRDEITLYQDTLAKNPAAWMAHHNLAIALAGRGQLEEAVRHLEAVLKLRPDYAPAENNLGDDLLRLGRAHEAIPHLRRAVELQPRYAVAHRNLGRALMSADRTAEALAHFERAVQINPRDADAELEWAVALAMSDRFAESVPHFERALELRPEMPHVHHTYGRALARAGRLPEAVERFRTAIELDPDYAEAHWSLAHAFRDLGRRDDAARHYRIAVELDPRLAQPN